MTDHTKFDWPAIRNMVRAPAYFARRAMNTSTGTGLERGQSPEERGAKTLRTRERLSDAEIKRLNAVRRRNGGGTL